MIYSVACYGLHKLSKLSLHAVHEKIFKKIFQGRSHALFSQLAQDFVRDKIDSMFYVPALKKLEESMRSGHHIVLISSSPSFLVSLIAARLGIKEFYATDYDLDPHGNFISISKVLDGEAKAELLLDIIQRKGVSQDNTIAYTDSHLDLPFLIQAGNAVGVNPDSKLRTVCKQMGWEII